MGYTSSHFGGMEVGSQQLGYLFDKLHRIAVFFSGHVHGAFNADREILGHKAFFNCFDN